MDQHVLMTDVTVMASWYKCATLYHHTVISVQPRRICSSHHHHQHHQQPSSAIPEHRALV